MPLYIRGGIGPIRYSKRISGNRRSQSRKSKATEPGMAAVMRIVYAEDARLSRQRIAAIDAQKAKKLAEITAEANLAKRTAELQARAKHLEEIRENARKFEELQAKTAAELQAKRAAKNAADVAQFWADHDEAQPKPVLKTAEPQLAPVPELFDEQEKAEQFETLWAEK